MLGQFEYAEIFHVQFLFLPSTRRARVYFLPQFDHILLLNFLFSVEMAFRKFGVTAVGTLLGGTFATYALRPNEEVLARVEMEGKPIKRARKLPMRPEQLASLQSGEEYDILIIGGGATGAGCALDACTRGLKTALVEANDFASGTSSRSTKLIHGGVRYLQKAILGVS